MRGRAWKKSNLMFNRIIASTTIVNSLCVRQNKKKRRNTKRRMERKNNDEEKKNTMLAHSQRMRKNCIGIVVDRWKCNFFCCLKNAATYRIHVEKCSTSILSIENSSTNRTERSSPKRKRSPPKKERELHQPKEKQNHFNPATQLNLLQLTNKNT